MSKYEVNLMASTINKEQVNMLCAIANELHLIEQHLARIARKK